MKINIWIVLLVIVAGGVFCTTATEASNQAKPIETPSFTNGSAANVVLGATGAANTDGEVKEGVWTLPFGGEFEQGAESILTGPGSAAGVAAVAVLGRDLGSSYTVQGEVYATSNGGFVVALDPRDGSFLSVYSGNGGAEIMLHTDTKLQWLKVPPLAWPRNTWEPFVLTRKDNTMVLRIGGGETQFVLPGSLAGQRFGLVAYFTDEQTKVRNLSVGGMNGGAVLVEKNAATESPSQQVAEIVGAEQPNAIAATEHPKPAKAIAKPTKEAMRSLAQRICNGDMEAFDTLSATIVELYRDIDYTTDQERLRTNYSLGREAFDLLGQEAAKGNRSAFDALKAYLRETTAKGFAVGGMGIAAAGGHKESLSILLTADEHQITPSEAVGALIDPASANIEPAVEFLIKVIRNPDLRPLHNMASDGLKGAARKGNAKAKAALDELAQAQPKAEDVPAIPVTLKAGDSAPKLSVGQWVQGEPVNAFAKDKVYLVEFWATWCGPCVASIPHLNEIQSKYQNKGLVVIGQNIFEDDQSQVKPFVAKMGNKMTYRVAVDDASKSKQGAMNETWMLAAGQSGIPTAFLVGKDGKIIWIGHPMALKESMIEAALVGQ